MPDTDLTLHPRSAAWRLSVWLNNGHDSNDLLVEAIVDDLDQARTYAEQTAAPRIGLLGEESYVWVEAQPGHRVGRRRGWTPQAGAVPQIAVFTETQRLGMWIPRTTGQPQRQHEKD